MPSVIAEMRCSFCGRDKEQVTYLIAGPSVYICGVCVDICVDIINKAKSSGPSENPSQ